MLSYKLKYRKRIKLNGCTKSSLNPVTLEWQGNSTLYRKAYQQAAVENEEDSICFVWLLFLTALADIWRHLSLRPHFEKLSRYY